MILIYFSVFFVFSHQITSSRSFLCPSVNQAGSQPNSSKNSPLATEFCPEVIEFNLTWPQTDVEGETRSKEYCFNDYGFPLTRVCGKDDNDIVCWMPLTESCSSIPKKSSLTDGLLLLTESGSGVPQNVAEQLLEISKEYQQFSAFDVYLAASAAKWAEIDSISRLIEIFANIISIENEVLTESQTQMNALDVWVNVTDLWFMESPDGGFEFENQDFVLERNDSSLVSGLMMRSSDQQVVSIDSSLTLDDVLNNRDLETAIWIEPLSSGGTILTFILYFNNIFFSGKSSSERTGTVLTVKPQAYYPPPVYIIQKFNNETFTKNVKCGYWDTSVPKGSWINEGEFQISGSYFICKYSNFENFAMVFAPEKRVTDDLTDILSMDGTSTEILSRLYQLSSREEDILPIDLFLIGQILRRVSNGNDTDLDLLSLIVSNLHQVDKEVLLESQKRDNSTDAILYYTDVILQNFVHQSDYQLVTDNFITLVYTFETIDFSGIVLSEDKTIEILEGSVNSTDLSKYENLNSALILSSELKTQLSKDTKIVINIFLDDALFNEQKKTFNYNPVKSIYSVLIPELSNYSGPVSIFHKVPTNSGRQCSYWLYNPPESIAGFWKNETQAENVFSLVQCDYWHTTHFGLLLFDEDKYAGLPGLNIITNIGCSLSLVGYICILLTALLFSTWRAQAGKKVLLSFVISGLFQLIVFYISSNVTDYFDNYGLCVFTGIFLHYSVLVQFAWMLLIAIFQYRQLVLNQTEQLTHILLKTNLFAWGFPLLPVIVVVAANSENYASGNVGLCYPSGYALYFGVWWPISVVIVINLIICLFIIESILNKKNQNRSHGSESSLLQLRRIGFIFFLFGLTWIFGFLAEVAYSTVLVYFFEIFSTLQGFVLFLAYIVFDEEVRKLYADKVGQGQGEKFCGFYKVFKISKKDSSC